MNATIAALGAPAFWLPLLAMLPLAGYMVWSSRGANRPALPGRLLLLFLAARSLRALAGTPGWILWLDVAVALFGAWAAIHLLFRLLVEGGRRLRGRPPLPRITRDFVLLFLDAVALFVVLRARGNLQLAGLVTSTAVLTAIVGLAAQATITSFFSGVVLQIEKPFEQGDWIECEGVFGQVLAITWKATRLLTRENTLAYLPNDRLTAGRIVNYSKPDAWYTVRQEIGLNYETAPHLAREVLLGVIRAHPRIASAPPPEVRLLQFGDFAITYQMRYTLTDPGLENRIRAELNQDLWYALQRHDIRIPFPIRDVRMAHEERLAGQAQRDRMRSALVDRLAAVPLLAPLGDEDRQRLASAAELQGYGRGETVIRQGEPGDSMFVIHAGACEVLAGAGAERIALLGPGEVFGEMSLLTGAPRAATVRATEDLRVLVVTKSVFAGLLAGRPEVATALGAIMAERQAELQAAARTPACQEAASKSLAARIRAFFGLGG